jgi:hypothetical protein
MTSSSVSSSSVVTCMSTDTGPKAAAQWEVGMGESSHWARKRRREGARAPFMCTLADAALLRLTTPTCGGAGGRMRNTAATEREQGVALPQHTFGPEKVKKIHLVLRNLPVPKPMRNRP